MKKITKEDITQDMYGLYDDYAHNKLNRKDFIQRLSVYAVGGLTLPSLLSFMLPNYQDNIKVKADDPRLKTEFVKYDSLKGGGKIKAQLSMPADAKGKLPGVVVVHENRGLNPYIEDVGRRVALAGFISLAPDALTPLGGYPGNDDDGRELQKQRDRDEMLEDFIAAFEYLKNLPECDGNVGVVGFCFGGWISNLMAVRIPDLKAAVPFYGGQPDADEVPSIQAPLLLQYAGLDERVNAGWPAYEAALIKNNKEYIAYIYPDVNHGFHNDTTPRYNEEAANLAWDRTIEFFRENLK
ncbi:MAG TPA: dienelactone hydrolase family protein [Bacteroidales bacterium]